MNGAQTDKIKLLIVIPVYNHAGTLREVVIRALDVCSDVLVVDDGSTDGSGETIKGLPVRIVSHEVNKGKGAAILTAVEEARRIGMSHIITIDADGQHDPADAARFMLAIEKDPLAIVVGKRHFNSKSVPFSSRFGRVFSNFWLRVQTGYSIKDTQSGFRAYPIVIFDRLKLYDRRYSFEIEVLVRAAWAGIALREVDISVYYPEPDKRISHFRPFMDNLRITMLNTRLTTRALLPIPHKRFLQTAEDAEDARKITLLYPIESLRILLRKNVSPERLAASGGLGVFLGALPLIACQALVILATANYFRLNKYAALGTSQICNPPIVPALCIETGYFIRHGKFLTEISLKTLGYQGLERILEWIIGALVLGPLMGIITAGIIYAATIFLKKRRPATGG
jgi:glycosyltransferase involved in cell wall biosynthesis